MEKGANKGKRIKKEEGWVGFKSYDGNSWSLECGVVARGKGRTRDGESDWS